MKKGISTAALAAAFTAASVSASAQAASVAAPPDAAATPSPLIGVWCWRPNWGLYQLDIQSVTQTSFTGHYRWIGTQHREYDVVGKVDGHQLDFWTSGFTHWNLTLKNGGLFGEEKSNLSNKLYWAAFKRVGCKPS
jgi:hypothetical protein